MSLRGSPGCEALGSERASQRPGRLYVRSFRVSFRSLQSAYHGCVLYESSDTGKDHPSDNYHDALATTLHKLDHELYQ